MKAMKLVAAMLMVMLGGGALADTSGPAGVWKSIDDKRAKMSLSEDGKSLKVRGFIGVSLIGRTQTWWREQ